MGLAYISEMREDACGLCLEDMIDFSTKAAGKCLSARKVRILRMVAGQETPRTITGMVNDISAALGFPKSTVWDNINSLKYLGLIRGSRRG